MSEDLHYICVEGPRVERLENLVGRERLHQIAAAGGKFVFSNRPPMTNIM